MKKTFSVLSQQLKKVVYVKLIRMIKSFMSITILTIALMKTQINVKLSTKAKKSNKNIY